MNAEITIIENGKIIESRIADLSEAHEYGKRLCADLSLARRGNDEGLVVKINGSEYIVSDVCAG